jgi:hypothetical protein
MLTVGESAGVGGDLYNAIGESGCGGGGGGVSGLEWGAVAGAAGQAQYSNSTTRRGSKEFCSASRVTGEGRDEEEYLFPRFFHRAAPSCGCGFRVGRKPKCVGQARHCGGSAKRDRFFPMRRGIAPDNPTQVLFHAGVI